MAEITSFKKEIQKNSSAYLDTNIFIYHLEDRLPYSELTQIIFDKTEEKSLQAHTSALTLLELNVKPYQLNRPDRALAHFALLKNLPHLFIHSLNPEMSDTAARLRAKYKLKTPDAIHLACALESRSEIMIGNDKGLKKIADIHYLYLNDYL